jgi:hypothetical protein
MALRCITSLVFFFLFPYCATTRLSEAQGGSLIDRLIDT